MPEVKIDGLDLAQEACVNGHPEIAEDLLCKGDQTDARVMFNLGWHTLRHGKLTKGIEMLDAGRFINVYGSPPLAGKTMWNPAKIDPRGKTILLRSEGGYGDEIINARFATVLAARGAKVVLACHPSLMSLLASVDGVAAVVSTAAVYDCHYDYWLPAMSAPHVLGLEFPDHASTAEKLSGKPYLHADPVLREKWRRILKGKVKVGLRWRGNPKFEHQQFRTFDPESLFALSGIEGVECYSLQRDEGAELLPADSEVVDLGPMLTSWDETAAVIANLDLVVSSCTAIAHLAAALGVPTWVVVPVMPYYTWTYSTKRDGSSFGGNTSPWHDTVRLFRQEKFGEWDAPLLRVVHGVRDLATPGWRKTLPTREMATCDGGLA